MLEAVNSVLQAAPIVKASAEQASTVDSFAANPERVQRAPPQAPYISPYIYLDVNFDKAVIQLRNGETGDVVDQYPSQATLEQQARRAAAQQAAREATTQQQSAPRTEAQSAQTFVQQTAPQPSAQQQSSAPTQEQIAAFETAARSGNSNAGTVTLFA